MRLVTHCHRCNKEMLVKGSFANRWELSSKKGKEFDLKCPNCSHKSIYSVDDVKARAGIFGTISLLLLFTCIAVVIWFIYPYSIRGIIPMFLLPLGFLIPALIYYVILREHKRKIENFNSTRPNSLRTLKFKRKF